MRRTLFVILILIMICIPNMVLAEEDLIITNWVVESELLENGDLTVSEELTFKFNKKFNGVYRSIVLNGIGGISDIHVSEISNGNIIPYGSSGDAKKGDENVFDYELNNEGIRILIFAPSSGESRTFRITYLLNDVAVIHKDIGELYYKYIGSENETKIDNFFVSIKLPEFDENSVRIFAHGPLNGLIYFEDNQIKLNVENVPSGTFVEARVLYPPDYTPFSEKTGNMSLGSILDEERDFAENIKRSNENRAILKNIFNYVSIGLSAIAVLLLGFIFRKYRRNPDIYDSMTSLKPDYITPAEVNLFLNQAASPRGLMATIFDLADRGYITIEEVNDRNNLKKKEYMDYLFIKNKNPYDGLLEHEEFLLDWLFNIIGDGYQVSTTDIDKERKKSSLQFNKNLNQWFKLVNKSFKLRDYMDKSALKSGIVLLILSPVFLIPGIISIAYGIPAGILLVFISVYMFIYSFILMNRKTDKGFIQYNLWKDFKKEAEGLRTISMDMPNDKSMIYAVALGLTAKKLDMFRQSYSSEYYPLYWGYWFFLYNDKGGSRLEDRFYRGFYGSTTNTSGTSSSFGGGGGFSGGGGGGSGGGGAGGF